jgi:glycosyltransferase involved in cell wall biosynthesis
MISFIVPLHNEEDNIIPLVDSLLGLEKEEEFKCEIILVNDHSNDKTPKLADFLIKKYKHIRAIHRNNNMNGMGYALIDGTKISKGSLVCWIMGDRSDDLTAIRKMREKIESGFDMEIG